MRYVCLLLAALGLASVAGAAEPARVVLEAESFAPSAGWRVIRFGENYFHGCIGASYISRERLLSAAESLWDGVAHPNGMAEPRGAGASATRTVKIPRAARYKVWVHYEAPYGYNTRFGLRIEQGGRVVFDSAYGGAEVLGTFADGSPAIVRNYYGAGQAILVGTLPGIAYLKSGIPVQPMDRDGFTHFLPTKFSPEIRALIGLPLQLAGVMKPVECSEPLVDASLLESARGIIIPLANFTGKPIQRLRVTLRDVGAPRRIYTTERGELRPQMTADGIVVEFPIGLTDFLVLEP